MFIGCYGEMEDPKTHSESRSYNRCVRKKTVENAMGTETVYLIGLPPMRVEYRSTNANLFEVGDTVEIVKWTKKK
jgi:hypothetical protein